MYLVIVEGEVLTISEGDDVVDHIESSVCFEVDATALSWGLKHMEAGETITLRDDCWIERI
jgi:hypothetical protein